MSEGRRQSYLRSAEMMLIKMNASHLMFDLLCAWCQQPCKCLQQRRFVLAPWLLPRRLLLRQLLLQRLMLMHVPGTSSSW